MLYPGESSLDSNPLMWLLLIVVVIIFIAFWASVEPALQKLIAWVILISCIGAAVLFVAAQSPH